MPSLIRSFREWSIRADGVAAARSVVVRVDRPRGAGRPARPLRAGRAIAPLAALGLALGVAGVGVARAQAVATGAIAAPAIVAPTAIPGLNLGVTSGATPGPGGGALAPAPGSPGTASPAGVGAAPSDAGANGSSGGAARGRSPAARDAAEAGAPRLPTDRAAPLDGTDGRGAPGATVSLADAAPPPNDFQRFVEAATGQLPVLFGMNLFRAPPSTFAPAGDAAVPADYAIGPGDELLVRITGSLDVELRPTVDRDGRIVIPRVGTVSVAGVRRGELERHLSDEVGRTWRHFTLSATLAQLRSIDVYVVGHARRPGRYTVSSLSTLVNALFASGGPDAHGSLRRVQLVRDDRTLVALDLYDFIVRGDKRRDVRLQPGDTIVFPPAGPRVALLGAVAVPAVYELAGADAPVSEVLGLSGGLPVLASPLRAQLQRIDPQASPARRIDAFALDAAGQARRLRDGDLLTVMPIGPQFANAVTLRGNVAAPLRHPFTPGMRIRDLIPEPDALITADYHLRRNRLVEHADAADGHRRDLRTPIDEVNWDYAVVERLDARRVRTELIPFHLGRAVLDGDPAHDLELREGDIVTVFGQRDLQLPQERRSRTVRIEGEVAAPGLYAVAPDETLQQLVARIGGLTGSAYVFGTELARDSVRRVQQSNLAAIVDRLEDRMASELAARQAALTAAGPQAAAQQARLAGDERRGHDRLQRLRSMKPSGRVALELDPTAPVLPAIALEDGDRIVVPARPAFVSVVGSVLNENVLMWRAGRDVDGYLASAGPTEGADLDQVFVLRADGSIASRPTRGGFGRRGVGALVLAPGDTIVVPEKVDRETRYAAFMRNLKDWTQVVGQLGLGAAALKVLTD